MEINDNVLKEFANLMAGESETKNNKGVSTVYGTVTQNGDNTYVKIDGSEILTPVTEAMGAANGDRVIVMIKDHQAIITGNVTTPAVDNIEDIQELEKSVDVKFEVTDTKIESSVSALDAQLSTKITQTEESIYSVASRVDTVEDTQITLQSEILQNAENISLKVSSDEVVSAINMSSDTIELTAGRLIIDSGNFTLSKSGNISCSGGTIGPFTIDGSHLYNSQGTELWSNTITAEFINAVNIGTDSASTLYVGSTQENVVLGSVNKVLRIDATIKAPGIKNRTSTATANVRLQDGSECYLAYIASSSARYKHYITDVMDDGLNPERLYDLPVRQYIYNDDYLDYTDGRSGQYVPGFIAEEMDEYYPIAADYDEYGRPENWSERYIIPPMLALIQSQHEEIENLKNEIAIIKENVEG